MARFGSIEEYLAALPNEQRARVDAVRDVAARVLPGFGERISYDIPTFSSNGTRVVHVAAWKQHLALYPVPAGDDEFRAAIAGHVTGKGTAQFRHRDELPLALIEQLIRFRLAESGEPDPG